MRATFRHRACAAWLALATATACTGDAEKISQCNAARAEVERLRPAAAKLAEDVHALEKVEADRRAEQKNYEPARAEATEALVRAALRPIVYDKLTVTVGGVERAPGDVEAVRFDVEAIGTDRAGADTLLRLAQAEQVFYIEKYRRASDGTRIVHLLSGLHIALADPVQPPALPDANGLPLTQPLPGCTGGDIERASITVETFRSALNAFVSQARGAVTARKKYYSDRSAVYLKVRGQHAFRKNAVSGLAEAPRFNVLLQQMLATSDGIRALLVGADQLRNAVLARLRPTCDVNPDTSEKTGNLGDAAWYRVFPKLPPEKK